MWGAAAMRFIVLLEVLSDFILASDLRSVLELQIHSRFAVEAEKEADATNKVADQ
jgi:hypothetical protein